jgi:hypothetical protein
VKPWARCNFVYDHIIRNCRAAAWEQSPGSPYICRLLGLAQLHESQKKIITLRGYLAYALADLPDLPVRSFFTQRIAAMKQSSAGRGGGQASSRSYINREKDRRAFFTPASGLVEASGSWSRAAMRLWRVCRPPNVFWPYFWL